MRACIVIPLALMGLFSVGGADAMTNMQVKQLAIAAYKGNTTDLAKLEAAATSGDAAAQTELGSYWYSKKNYAKTNYWYEKAAAQGNAWSECYLGLAYYLGQGVPKDYAKAVYWYGKAADQGNVLRDNYLGRSTTTTMAGRTRRRADVWMRG